MTKDYFDTILDACKKANKELSKYLTNLSSYDLSFTGTKGAGGDYMMNIDKIAEDIFVKYLLKFANIQSEESGYIKSPNISNEYIIYLDPIDGSDNLRASLPYYGTSIALNIKNTTKLAFIYNLSNHTYFYKTPYCNNIKKNPYKNNLGIFERAYCSAKVVDKLHDKNFKFRSPGAVALSIANTYNYSFFLLDAKIRLEDITAGLYICNELNIYQNNKFLLICKNITIFNAIKEIIKDI
jgi:myo-inositol-1(or 4)-monophosphatase